MSAAVKKKPLDENDLLRAGRLPYDPFEGAVPAKPKPTEPDEPAARELPPFPLEVLPPLTRRCLEAFAAATQSPVELAAPSVVAAAAAAVGPGWIVGPPHFARGAVLWQALVCGAGSAKTPTARAARQPLFLADVRLREEWELEHAAWKERLSASRRKGPRQGEEPGPEPVRRRLLVTDTTPESLAVELQRAEGHGLLLHSDELASMLEGMDAYGNGGQKGRKFYLQCWSSEEVRISRRTSGPIEVDHPYMVVSGGIQQGVLSKMELQQPDGLCARFCWSVAPARPHGLGVEIPDRDRRVWGEIVRLLLGAGGGDLQPLEQSSLNFLDQHVWETTASAKELEDAGLGLLAAMHGKASDHLVRTAALLHALDAAEEAIETGGALRRRPVPLQTLERAAVLVNYHLAHGRRVVELILRPTEAADGGRVLSEAEAVGAALARVVPPGECVEATPGEWTKRLDAAGLELEGRGQHGRAIRVGRLLGALAANPVPPVRVRKLERGGGKDGRGRSWEVTHDAA